MTGWKKTSELSMQEVELSVRCIVYFNLVENILHVACA